MIGSFFKTSKGFEQASFGLFLVTLVWAPFPLGSNRPWSWALLCLLVAICWLMWLATVWARPESTRSYSRGLIVPLCLAVLALCWGLMQVLAVVPQAWAHPVWQLADGVLRTHTSPVISLSPWRTETELMKLVTYAMAAWLARLFASRTDRARILLDTLIGAGALYSVYGLTISSLGFAQFSLFYAAPIIGHDVSGPFVNQNSFATYEGLAALGAGIRLIETGAVSVVTGRGFRPFALSLLQYLVRRGILYLIAAALTVSALMATGSRAGNFAALAGVVSILGLSMVLGVRQSRGRWVATASIAIFLGIAALFAINGNLLASRLNDIADSRLRDGTRLMLWDAASHMIHDSPYLGLGLGTYENAYPMYADLTTPYVMDKAHNDYLELAAGWGLPAAILWLSSLAGLVFVCARGVLTRRRDRGYPLLAVGASVLVAVHSIFDFSLQMPAIAFTYAAILGLGVAQAFSTRNETDRPAGGAPSPLRLWGMRLAFLLPALAVLAAGVPRLTSGLAQEAAFPATAYIAMNVVLPQSSYVGTALVLSHAALADGETQIARADADMHARAPLDATIATARDGLTHAPGSARGWILLARLLHERDPDTAAAALSLAFELAPHEYFLIAPRVLAGAPLWGRLPPETQNRLVEDAHRVAVDNDFHETLLDLLRLPGGPELVTRAFADHPDDLRALNRRLARERLGL